MASKGEDAATQAGGNASTRIHWILLGSLILLHLALALEFHQRRGFYPEQTVHSPYLMTLDFIRGVNGYKCIHDGELPDRGARRFFTGEREKREGSRIALLWHELTQGRLQGLWRNHPPITYCNELPLPYMLAGLVYMMSGGSIVAATLTPQIYLAILLLSVYGLGRSLANPWVGLAAAAIASGYTGIFGMARTHHDSTALAALSMALVYLLLRSDGFRKLGAVLTAGVVAFLAMRSGEAIPKTILVGLVVSFPFLFAVKRMVDIGRRDHKAAIRGAAGLAIFLIMVLGPFEWTRLTAFFGSVNDTGVDAGAYPQIQGHHSPLFSALLWYLAYPVEVALRLVRPVMTLWFLAGVLFFLRRPVGARRIAVGMMFLLPLILLSLVDRKGSWYLAPLLPPMALITALGLTRIRTHWLRGVALGLAASCGILVLCFHTLASAELHRRADLNIIAPKISNAVRINDINLLRFDAAYRRACIAQSAENLAEHVRLNPPPAGEGRVVAMLATDQHSAQSFRYIVEMREPRIFLLDLLSPMMREETYPVLEKVDFDYLIYITEDGLIPWVEGPPSKILLSNDWKISPLRSDRPWPKALTKIIKRLRTKKWERIDLGGKPIYRRIDRQKTFAEAIADTPSAANTGFSPKSLKTTLPQKRTAAGTPR